MKRTLDIAATNQDPSGQITVAVLETFAKLDPTKVPVFSTFDGRQVGHCTRFWCQDCGDDGHKRELWADMEVDDRSVWPGPESVVFLFMRPIHCEAIVAFKGQEPQLLAVIVTDLPRGALGQVLKKQA